MPHTQQITAIFLGSFSELLQCCDFPCTTDAIWWPEYESLRHCGIDFGCFKFDPIWAIVLKIRKTKESAYIKKIQKAAYTKKMQKAAYTKKMKNLTYM